LLERPGRPELGRVLNIEIRPAQAPLRAALDDHGRHRYGLDEMARPSKPWKEIGRYGGVGIEFVLTILIVSWVGHWLDSRYSFHGWGLATGFLLGCAVAFRNLVRVAGRMQRDIERAEAHDPAASRWTVDESWLHKEGVDDGWLHKEGVDESWLHKSGGEASERMAGEDAASPASQSAEGGSRGRAVTSPGSVSRNRSSGGADDGD
jgi:F0F1-type ATP synthase assembly protein I